MKRDKIDKVVFYGMDLGRLGGGGFMFYEVYWKCLFLMRKKWFGILFRIG